MIIETAKKYGRACAKFIPLAAVAASALAAPVASAKTSSNTQEALPEKVIFADVDGNNVADFVEFNGQKVVIRRSDFDGRAITDDLFDLQVPIRTMVAGAFGGGSRDQLCAVFTDNSLRCFGISSDGQSMWWWFTQGSFIAVGEQAMVGDFNGDGKKDILVYRPSDGNIRLYGLRSTGAFFDPIPFTLGNLSGIDRRNKQIRVGEFGQSSLRSDIIVIDTATRALWRYDTAIDASGNLTFWWAWTATGHFSSSEDVTVANIAGQTTDDLVFRNRTNGAYRFTKAEISNNALLPITNVRVGQLPTTPGGRVYWAKAGPNGGEPGGTRRDDAFFIQNGWLVRTDARWDSAAGAMTYWWYYSKSAPKYSRSQRRLDSLTAAERSQLSNLMREYITEARVSEHSAGHDWHSTTEAFFYQHRRFITSAEEFLLSRGASAFVPMPMWDPNTTIPSEFTWVLGARPALANLNPRRALPSNLAGTAVCQYSTANALNTAVNSWHGDVHITVGGTMANASISPAAVIFWPWHAFVDNIYARWHDCR